MTIATELISLLPKPKTEKGELIDMPKNKKRLSEEGRKAISDAARATRLAEGSAKRAALIAAVVSINASGMEVTVSRVANILTLDRGYVRRLMWVMVEKGYLCREGSLGHELVYKQTGLMP